MRMPESSPRRIEHRDLGLSIGELVEGLAALVVAVSVFLPWFGVLIGPFGVSATGVKDHPYLYVALVLSLIELAVLATGMRTGGLGKLSLRRELLLAEINVLTLAIVVLAFVAKGNGLAGWRLGAWMAVGAAGAGAVASLVVARFARARV